MPLEATCCVFHPPASSPMLSTKVSGAQQDADRQIPRAKMLDRGVSIAALNPN
jgi:hypothetical protein